MLQNNSQKLPTKTRKNQLKNWISNDHKISVIMCIILIFSNNLDKEWGVVKVIEIKMFEQPKVGCM